eukprot:PITA_35912
MSSKDNEEIRKQVQELLDKGLIWESLGPCVVLTILAPTKGGEWRMCTDSWVINKITTKYTFPLPQMDDVMDFLNGAMYFSKIYDYHQIKIGEGDEWKTTFKTNEGLFEWLVMPFGLRNAPNKFSHLMNEMLKEFIGKFVIVYLDDILIFNKMKGEHFRHVSGQVNKVADALSMRSLIFQESAAHVLGFKHLKDLNEMDADFKEDYEACQNLLLRDNSPWLDYNMQERLLFKGGQLCIPECSMRVNLIQEKHSGRLAGHFGIDKTFDELNHFYYWPRT